MKMVIITLLINTTVNHNTSFNTYVLSLSKNAPRWGVQGSCSVAKVAQAMIE